MRALSIEVEDHLLNMELCVELSDFFHLAEHLGRIQLHKSSLMQVCLLSLVDGADQNRCQKTSIALQSCYSMFK